jgi:hypothetical protein
VSQLANENLPPLTRSGAGPLWALPTVLQFARTARPVGRPRA